jgi:hypothetical protein
MSNETLAMTNDHATNDHATKRPTISTLAFVWALIRKKPWGFLGYTVGWSAFSLLNLVPGLVEQRIFDNLTGAAEATRSVWTLLAFFVTAEIVRVLANYLVRISDIAFQEPMWPKSKTSPCGSPTCSASSSLPWWRSSSWRAST